MNQELAEFFVKFTTKNFAEVKDAIDTLSKKMDEVGEASEKASDKQKGFFDKVGGKGWGWIGKLTSMATAVWALKKAWDAVGNAAASTMTIYQQAMLAGTSPQTLERWQWASRHYGDKNIGAIIGDFRSGNEFLQRFKDAKISESFNEVFGRAQLGTGAIIQSLEAGNLDAVLLMLNTALSARDENGNALINSARAKEILDQIGFSDSMQILLRLQNLSDVLANADLIYTKNPETLAASIKYQDAKETLKDSWNKIWANPEMINKATALMELINNKVLPEAERFFRWLLDKVYYLLEGKTLEQKEADERKAMESLVKQGMAVDVTNDSSIKNAVSVRQADGSYKKYILSNEFWSDIDSYRSPKTWEDLTPKDQFALFSNPFLNPDIQVPNYTMSVNGGKAIATVNIDGHTVQRTESGNIAVLDLMSPVPLNTR